MGYDEHMKLTVHNLGRIKDAELDIKPLTVFSGHNGTSKTWLAWTVFEHLRLVSTEQSAAAVIDSEHEVLSAKVREKLAPRLEAWAKGTATPSVTLDIGEMDVWPSDLYQAELKHDKLSGLLSSSSRVAADARVGISIPIHEMGAQHKSITVTFDQESNELHFVSCLLYTSDAADE